LAAKVPQSHAGAKPPARSIAVVMRAAAPIKLVMNAVKA